MTEPLYHGTTKSAAASILSQGLKPGEDSHVWVTTDRNTAFMNGAMRQFHAKRTFSDTPTLLLVTIPNSTLITHGSTDRKINQTIPASHIREIPLTRDEQEYVDDTIAIRKRQQSYGWK